MIQFNLLPDVKLEYIKTKRTQALVILVSTILSIAAVAIFVILFLYVSVLQKHHINNLSSQVSADASQLSSNPNLDKILTIQNQLQSLPALDQAEPAATKLLPFINQLTPASATISNLSINFAEHTGSIQGNADSLVTVNTYVDTLKFTDYKVGSSQTNSAFSNVVLSSFSTSASSTGVTYTITFSYNPIIFDVQRQATLSVPQIVTTRSITQLPTDLFLNTSSGAK